MNKGKRTFLIFVVIIVVAIIAVLAINSQNLKPVQQEELHLYSEEQASERLETLREAQSNREIEVLPMKFFVEEIRPDDGTFVVSAITTMRSDDIAAISFRATNSSVPSAIKWYSVRKQESGQYRLKGSAADLGMRGGTYTIDAFITPTGGGETEAGSIDIEMELTNYFYSESITQGQQSLVLVGPKVGDEEIAGVRFKAWSVEDDQDDIKTYIAKESDDGVWTAEIDVRDFDGQGEFVANAYAVIDEEETGKTSAGEKKEDGGTEKTPAGENSTAVGTEEKSEDSAADTAEDAAAGAEEKAEDSAADSTEEKKEDGGTEKTSAGENSTSVAAEEKQDQEEGEEEELPGIEVGVASARFELIPEPREFPEGAGEVVKKGKSLYVKVPEIIQTPELPTGCESVALTIVLNSFGYKLEKTDIAKNYLERGTDMATSYVGDPFSKNGAGCFPPAIVNAADKYLEEKGDKRTGHNITGTSIDDLCTDYIENGFPVIVWSSIDMTSPDKTGGAYTYQGQSYQWYGSEHCVVLYGYDKGKDVYLVSDPLVGLVERDAAAFRDIYEKIGEYAVVIY